MMTYKIDETVRLNSLFDLYYSLLTDKQQEYFKYYFRDDFSLSEIADIMEVSRNAVHLQIKKISAYLEKYEEKLEMLNKNEKRNTIIENLLEDENISKEIKDRIKKIEKV